MEKQNKITYRDINISQLPIIVTEKEDVQFIMVSTGQHIIYEEEGEQEEILTPVITFRYKNLNNKIVAI